MKSGERPAGAASFNSWLPVTSGLYINYGALQDGKVHFVLKLYFFFAQETQIDLGAHPKSWIKEQMFWETMFRGVSVGSYCLKCSFEHFCHCALCSVPCQEGVESWSENVTQNQPFISEYLAETHLFPRARQELGTQAAHKAWNWAESSGSALRTGLWLSLAEASGWILML